MKSTWWAALLDVLLLAFMLTGTAWMWGLFTFKSHTQEKLNNLFVKSRPKFKWMFLIGTLFILVARLARMGVIS